MPNRSNHRNIIAQPVLNSNNVTINILTNSTAVDVKGRDAQHFNITTIAASAAGVVTLEDSADGVTYAAVDATQVEGDGIISTVVPATTAIAYLGVKQYVRAVLPASKAWNGVITAVGSSYNQVPVNPKQV